VEQINLQDILKDIIKKRFEQEKQKPLYQEFKQYEQEINNFRNNIQPMTDEQGNKFRHLAGAGAMAQNRGFWRTNYNGLGKEFEDYFIKRKGLKDSLGDIKNNFTGSLYGFLNKDKPRSELYRLIYDKEVK